MHPRDNMFGMDNFTRSISITLKSASINPDAYVMQQKRKPPQLTGAMQDDNYTRTRGEDSTAPSATAHGSVAVGAVPSTATGADTTAAPANIDVNETHYFDANGGEPRAQAQHPARNTSHTYINQAALEAHTAQQSALDTAQDMVQDTAQENGAARPVPSPRQASASTDGV